MSCCELKNFLLVIAFFACGRTQTALAQFASIPQGGIAPYLDYQHSDIDSVNLSNGNVNLHIPLVSFPQLGSKLQLNFVIRFNSPKWVVNDLTSVLDTQTGLVHYAGIWDIERTNFSAPSPVGVDVVRDQGLTAEESVLTFMCVASDNSGPGDCDDGTPAWQSGAKGPFSTNSYRYGVRDRSGAEHSIGQWGVEPNAGPLFQFITAPDGSGWTPVAPSVSGNAPTVYYDRKGLKYTQIGIDSPSQHFLWNTVDPEGNAINATESGWTDSVGRTIPGSWSGPGNGLTTVNSAPVSQVPMEDDPFPGVVTSDKSGCNTGATAARLWLVPTMNLTPTSDSTASYKLCYTPQQASTQFNVTTMDYSPAGVGVATASGLLLTQIILPNNTSYTFTYDSYFDLASISLPTGGTISYSWTTIPWDPLSTAQPVVRAVKSRTVTPDTGATAEVWNYTWSAAGGLNIGEIGVTANITKPDANDETHVSGFVSTTSVKYYQGSSPSNPNGNSGILLRTESTTSQILKTPFSEPLPPLGNVTSSGNAPTYDLYTRPWSYQDLAIGPPLSKTVTLENGTVSQTVYSPVMGTTQWINFGENSNFAFSPAIFSGPCACISYGLNSSVSEYDFGTTGSGTRGALLRTTSTTYKWSDGSSSAAAYLSANLLDLPSSVTVTGSKNSATTNYTYDETAYSPGSVMGNLTTTSRVNSLGANAVTHTIYNSLGMRSGTIDANGNQATVSAFQCSGLFPQTVVSPYQSTTTVAETSTYVFDCNTGKMTSYQDSNLKTTSYVYTDTSGTLDPFVRLREIKSADGGDFQINYNRDPAPPVVTLTTTTGEAAGPMVQTIMYDGLGRTTQVQLNSDPQGIVYTNTAYDVMGRKQSQTNPYRTTNDSTYGSTKYTYDALGRMAIQTNPDHTTKQWCYDNANSAGQTNCNSMVSSGTGAWEDIADENGNDHQETSDALGRLTSVAEPNGTTGTPSMITNYSYDVLNNLWGVSQNGVLGTDTPRISRSFTYDNLSRLLCASNPENSTASCPTVASSSYALGTTGYSYDSNGNVTSRTDARSITTSYTYDALNRIVAKGYSDGTASACYRYDVAATSGTTANLSGHLTGEWTQTGNCPAANVTLIPSSAITAQAFMQYDSVGRLKNESYCTPQSCNFSNSAAASYDLAGNMTSLTYPDGRVVSQVFDAAARVTSVNYSSWQGTSMNTPYMTVNVYDADSHPTSWAMGSGTGTTTATSTFNPRLELTSLGYAQGSNPALWGKSYSWTSNGNVQSITDGPSGVIRKFGYDSLNRLTYAQDTTETSGDSGQTTNSSDQTQSNVLEDSQTLGSAGWGGE